MRADSFRPSLDGFRFPNEFGERGTVFGLGAPLLPAFGLGAGMAWVALDRYLAGRPMPALSEPPARASALHAELVMRQANALAAAPWSRLVEWQALPERALPGRPSLAARSRTEWNRARPSLDAGLPVMLFLVLARGRHANPSANRPVLAVGYEMDRHARRASILVYDPGRPGNDNLRLTFRTGATGALEARFGDTTVHGFVSVTYDRAVPAALSLDTVDDSDAHTVDAVVAVRGRDSADGPLEILATQHPARGGSGNGGIIRIRRDRPGRCSSESLPKPEGAALAHGRASVAMVDSNRIVARATSGDLLEFRRRPLLGWRVRNITQSRRIDPAFRIDGNPAVVRGRDGVIVFACGGGRLVRYRCDRLGRWKADQVDTQRLGRMNFIGTPALIEHIGLHVLCRTETGELIHLHDQRKPGWTATSVPTAAGGQARAIVVDDPIFLRDPTGKGLNAITRSKEGAVLLLRWSEQQGWSAIDLSASSRPEKGLPPAMSPLSAVFDEEGTVHVAARDAQGGLIHVWCTTTGSRGGEQVTRLRAIGARGRIDGAPRLANGPAGALHVVAHQDRALLLFRWTPVGGWSVESVSRDRGTAPAAGLAGEPVVACIDSTMHVAFADDAGRLFHACTATRRPLRPEAKREPLARRLTPRFGRPAPVATNDAQAVLRKTAVDSEKPAPPDALVTPEHRPDAPVIPVPPRPIQDTRRIERPNPATHRSPALEGLPLLPDDEGAPRRQPAAVPASKKSSTQAAPVRSPTNETEMERIMALAERNPLQRIDPK